PSGEPMNLKKFLKPRRYLFLGVLALALAESLPLQASPIMIAGSTTANTPSTGNSFDFNLFNSGPGFLSIGGFSLEISVSDTHVTFTSATTATSLPYVFAGHSLFGPTITTSPAGQTMDASDLWDLSGATPTLASGATVGLAHIFFNVSAGAPSGPLTVSVAAFPSSSL